MPNARTEVMPGCGFPTKWGEQNPSRSLREAVSEKLRSAATPVERTGPPTPVLEVFEPVGPVLVRTQAIRPLGTTLHGQRRQGA